MVETLRSIVHPWECDAVDHFTTAYYFQAYGAAQWHLLQLLGLAEDDMAAMRPLSCRTGFKQELRAGDAYHIESGLVDQGPGRLTLGHRLYNSETGKLASTHLQTFSGQVPAMSASHFIDWEEVEAGPEIDFGRYDVWSVTSQSIVRERDLDHTGLLDLSGLIHHTSDANVQFQNRIGMTSSYMAEKRIGFATFGYRIRIRELPRRPGTVMRTETALAHLGRSSLWFAHRVSDGLTNAPIADVAQLGVHFDRAARAPATIPDTIRQTAEGLLPRSRTAPA
jgi:acyl-CoA thioester hydrolase